MPSKSPLPRTKARPTLLVLQPMIDVIRSPYYPPKNGAEFANHIVAVLDTVARALADRGLPLTVTRKVLKAQNDKAIATLSFMDLWDIRATLEKAGVRFELDAEGRPGAVLVAAVRSAQSLQAMLEADEAVSPAPAGDAALDEGADLM